MLVDMKSTPVLTVGDKSTQPVSGTIKTRVIEFIGHYGLTVK